MIKSVLHKSLYSLVLLLTVVFLSPLLLKPLHLLAHEDHLDFSRKAQTEVTQKKEHCPTCDFHYFLFLEDISYPYDTLKSSALYSFDDTLIEQNTIKIIEAKLGRGPPEMLHFAPHLSI